MSRRGNRRRREDRRVRPPPDLHPSSTGTPTMNLADKMRSFYKMRERQAKEREERNQ